jgi:tetratricopeptide (TPR) repeat protein
MMTLSLLTLLACAARAPVALYPLDAHQPPPDLIGVFASQSPDALFEDAYTRLINDDLDGAEHRLVYLAGQSDGPPEALYHLGVVYELRGELETALSAYDLLLTRSPPAALAPNVHFRRGLCLEELGRFDEALKAFAKVPTSGGLSLNDRVTYDVARGVAMLRAGKEARGVELLTAALSTTRRDPELAWILGKGWYTLARHDLDQAAALPLDGAERKVKKNLEARAGLLMAAEAKLVHAVEQHEPEWILRGLLDLGDAYITLREDMLASPPPASLSAEQAAVYVAEVDKRTQVLIAKAFNAYDQGLIVAGTLGYEGELTETLRARREALPTS